MVGGLRHSSHLNIFPSEKDHQWDFYSVE